MTPIAFFTLCLLIGYIIGRGETSHKVEHSELSDPTINFPPIWFEGPHYRILEVLNENNREMSRKDINYYTGKAKYHAYERKLWLGGYVNRREERTDYGKVHYYTISEKGKNALEKYANQF